MIKGISIQPQTGTPTAMSLAAAAVRRRAGVGTLTPDLPPGHAPASTDPYDAILGGLPKPLTGAQITAQANQEISPLVAATTGLIGRQTAAATNAIRGYTSDAAAKLGAIDFTTPYTTGEQAQSAVDAALRGSLAGAGQAGADQLAQRLAVINDPTVGAAANALTANGAANGNTVMAQGSASLGNLIANAATAGSYGQKQPGITRLAGLQNIAQVGQQGQAAIAAKAAELEAQLPGIIQGLQSRNDSRSAAITAARENKLARNDAIAAGGAATETKYKLADASNLTKLQIAQMNADGRATAAQAAQAKSDRSYRLQFSKTFGYDPVTGQTVPGFTRNPDGTISKAGKAGGTTGAQVQSFLKGLTTYQTVSHNDGNGTSTSTKEPNGHSMDFMTAYKWLRQHGADDATARTDLAGIYKRGQDGRAWLTNEEQAVLKQAQAKTAGPGPDMSKAYVATVSAADGTKHRAAYLSASQVQWLQAANHLPKGEWGSLPDNPRAKVYWVFPGN